MVSLGQDSLYCFFDSATILLERNSDTSKFKTFDLKINLTLGKKDTIVNDVRVNFNILPVSKNNNEIWFEKTYLFFTKEEINKRRYSTNNLIVDDTITKTLILKVPNLNDTSIGVESFIVTLELVSESENVSTDTSMLVNIITNNFSINKAKYLFDENDTSTVGKISLISLKEIPVYKKYSRLDCNELCLERTLAIDSNKLRILNQKIRVIKAESDSIHLIYHTVEDSLRTLDKSNLDIKNTLTRLKEDSVKIEKEREKLNLKLKGISEKLSSETEITEIESDSLELKMDSLNFKLTALENYSHDYSEELLRMHSYLIENEQSTKMLNNWKDNLNKLKVKNCKRGSTLTELKDLLTKRIHDLNKELDDAYVSKGGNKKCHRNRRKRIKKILTRNSPNIKSARKFKNFEKNFVTTENLVEIESVDIGISNGQINSISVKIKGGYSYYRNRGPISLTNYDKKKYYHLHYIGADESKINTYISLKDILDYKPSNDRLYFPTKDKFTLDKSNNHKMLKLIGNPNSFFDVRAYTDAKALSGEANGLVQTEVNAQFITNSNNLGRSYLGFGRKVNMGFSWSKFDSNFDTLKFDSFDLVRNRDVLNLMRQSNTSFFIELDALSGTRVHDAYLKLGIKVYNTKVFDLSEQENAFARVFTPNFYAALGGRVFASPRINADFKFPLFVSYLHDQPFDDYENMWSSHIAPEIEVTLQLRKPDNTKKEERQRSFAFARIRYFDMPFSRGNNYWQIQTGVEIPFSSLFE